MKTTDGKSNTPDVLAPGKLFLLGEYAVLEGASALILAIDLWVRVTPLTTDHDEPNPLIDRARHDAEMFFTGDGNGPSWKADSEGLYYDGEKLGLGSSAAVTVATVAAVFARHGKDIENQGVREQMWKIAHDAHHAFQGSGSGADLAASIFGGCTHMRPAENERPATFEAFHLPTDAALSFVWTGRSASTGWFLEKIRELKHERREDYDKIITQMKQVLADFADNHPNAEGLIEALDKYGRSMRDLGTLSGAPIVTDAHETLGRLACRFGGSAKPSGAGGGDFSIAAFKSHAAKEAYERKARLLGFRPFAFEIATRGVHLDDESHT